MKLSAIIKGSICLLGFVGAGNILAAPANADQASARAATSITTPSSFTQSVSGEALLPGGLFFGGTAAVDATPGDPVLDINGDPVLDGNGDVTYEPNTGTDGTPASSLTVTPTTSTNDDGATKIDDLSFNAGEATSVSTVDGAGKISDVVAAILKGTNSNDYQENAKTASSPAVNAASIDDAAAIIKAAAGVNGLD